MDPNLLEVLHECQLLLMASFPLLPTNNFSCTVHNSAKKETKKGKISSGN